MEVLTPLKSSEEDSRQLPTGMVLDLVRQHDKELPSQLRMAKAIVATYITEYWSTTSGQKNDNTSNPPVDDGRLEINRIWPVATTMAASLYPRAARVACFQSYDGLGNAQRTAAALNDWGVRHEMRRRVLFGVTQAIVTGMVGWKIGFDAGTGRPTDRTHLTVVPRDGILLDTGVTDTRLERFRGHILWMPRKEAEAKYGLKNLRGTARQDHWGTAFGLDVPSPNAAGMSGGLMVDGVTGGLGGTLDADFVRVVEFYNLVDAFRARRGTVYRGRMDVYILDQPDDLSKRPVLSESMPFAVNGVARAPLTPLIFTSHPLYPYQPIPALKRMMPLQREYNITRTIHASQMRISAARKSIGRDGVLTGKTMDELLNGVDGSHATVSDEAKQIRLDDIVKWIEPPQVDPTLREHLKTLEVETTWVTAQAPNFRHEVTGSTKYESEVANRQTEIELAMYADCLYNSLTDGYQNARCAFISCLYDPSDSTGAFTAAGAVTTGDVASDVHVGAVGAVTTEEVADATKTDAPGSPGAEPTPTPVSAAPTQHASSAPSGESFATFALRVDGQILQINKDDLDGAPEIEFLDGVRTPMRDDARQQLMLDLRDPYLELWNLAQKGGPTGVLARQMMVDYVENFELPKSWAPDSLDKAVAALPSKKPRVERPDPSTLGAAAPTTNMPAAPEPQSAASVHALVQQAHDALAAGDVQGGAKLLQQLAEVAPKLQPVLDELAASEDPGAALLAFTEQILEPDLQPPAEAE